MHIRRLPIVLMALCAAVAACTAGAGELPVVRGSRPGDIPEWAPRQREVLELNATIAREFEKGFLKQDGALTGDIRHGGGVSAPDDVMETLAKLPLLYAMGAHEDTWRVYWKAYKGIAAQCTEMGLFENEMVKHLDWHHNGEQYQGFWMAALVAHDDPEYRRLAVKFAGFFDGSNPDVPNYDPEHKVVRSINCGGAGPILHATVKQWNADAEEGSEFWTPWRECGHDGPINLVTTNFGTTAYLLTGDEKHRKRTMEYIDAWRRRAEDNGGIIPSIVELDGTAPEQWWGGVMGWNFRQFGGLFHVSTGERVAWGNALLLTGDDSYYDSLRTVADEVWKHHESEEATDRRTGETQTRYYLPAHYDGKGWTGVMRHPHSQGIYASILANIYLATMAEQDLERLMNRVHSGIYAAGHAAWQEGGYERDWIAWLGGEESDWPVRELDRIIARSERDVADIRKEAAAGVEKRRARGWPRHWSWVGPVVNQRTGGIMPLWTGQLLLCRLFYFDPQRGGRAGMPADCAALVSALGDESVTVTLVNMNPDQSRTIIVQAGAYSEHRFTTVRAEGGKPVEVDGTRFVAELKPGSTLELTVGMERYVNEPVLGRSAP